jgi:hypothetical protein
VPIESRAGAPQIAALLAHYRSLYIDGALPPYVDFNPERLAEQNGSRHTVGESITELRRLGLRRSVTL